MPFHTMRKIWALCSERRVLSSSRAQIYHKVRKRGYGENFEADEKIMLVSDNNLKYLSLSI